MQQLNSLSINRAIDSLNNNNFKKIICGASNTDIDQIKKLSMIYSLSGVDVIDISACKDSIVSAKAGIDKAKEIFTAKPADFPNFNEPAIMISINAGNDMHFRKASIDKTLCNNCFSCINICPANALSSNEKKLEFNHKSCYGCGRCIDLCSNKAIVLKKNDPEQYTPENIEAIEIHTGNSSIRDIKDFLNSNPFITKVPELVSFSVESSLFDRKGLIDFVRSLVLLIDKKVIIQIDGKAMGASNNASSSLQAIAAAQLFENENLGFYLQIAGGTNHLTNKYIKDFDIKISGVGYGTFARKIILPYIVGLDDSDFFANLKKCVNITTNLVGNYSI
jgi:Fe-S-cluster-containing hydrogenase component 2